LPPIDAAVVRACVPIDVLRIHRCSGIQKCAKNGKIATFGANVQGSLKVFRSAVDLGTLAHHNLDQIVVAVFRHNVQGHQTISVF
jgi:hypothetical protein